MQCVRDLGWRFKNDQNAYTVSCIKSWTAWGISKIFWSLTLCFQTDETERFTENLSLFPSWSRHWGRQSSATSLLCCSWLILHLLSLWCFIAMVSEDLFDNKLQKGLICTSVKRLILGGLQNKIYSVSQVQICDHSCETLTFLCAIQIMSVMLRCFCSCQDRFISPLIFRLAIFTIGQLSVFWTKFCEQRAFVQIKK